jgi:hypothetical protein
VGPNGFMGPGCSSLLSFESLVVRRHAAELEATSLPVAEIADLIGASRAKLYRAQPAQASANYRRRLSAVDLRRSQRRQEAESSRLAAT